jgi:hypothetical protein
MLPTGVYADYMGLLNYDVAKILVKSSRPRLDHSLHQAYTASYNEKPEQQLMTQV